METLIHFVRKFSRVWLGGVIVATLLSGAMVARSGKCLKREVSPYGIVSFELAWNQNKAASIRNVWQNASCGDAANAVGQVERVSDKARQNIMEDFFFLVAYSLFFIVCLIQLDSSSKLKNEVTRRTKIFIFLAIAAGVLDAIENFFMWKFLQNETVTSYLFAFPATIKFLIVIALIIFIIYSFVKYLKTRKAR